MLFPFGRNIFLIGAITYERTEPAPRPHCEECVLNIAAIVNMTSPAVSHHLRILKSSGLIVSRRDGKEMYYKTADTELAQMLHHMIEKLGKITCPEDDA